MAVLEAEKIRLSESLLGQHVGDGRFEILELLDEKGLGRVYKAVEPATGKFWAIKEIVFGNGARFRQHLGEIAEERSRISHRDLCFHEVALEQDDRFLLAMPFVPGANLRDRLRATKSKMPPEAVLELALQVTDLLDYLHTREPEPIVFCNVKPANLMLTSRGELKLLDFGLARVRRPGSRHNPIIGTRGYAAPELFKAEEFDHRADLYALGILMRQLLTGVDPAKRRSSAEALVEGEFEEDLALTVARLTELDPSRRYPTARILRLRLSEILDSWGLPRPAGKELLVEWAGMEWGQEIQTRRLQPPTSELLVPIPVPTPKPERERRARSPAELLDDTVAFLAGLGSSSSQAAVLLKDRSGPDFVVRGQHHTTEPLGPYSQLLCDRVSFKNSPAIVYGPTRDLEKPNTEFASALCVPLREGEHCVGLLYVHSPRPNAYTRRELSQLEDYARRAGPGLCEARPRPARPSSPTRQTHPVVRFLTPLLLLCVAGGWVVFGMAMTPQEQAQNTLIAAEAAEAEMVAQSFLTALRLRQTESAEFFLSSDLRSASSGEELAKWAEREGVAWDLKYRKPVLQREGAMATVVSVVSEAPDRPRQAWRWFLKKGDRGWKIIRFDGGPPLKGLGL